MAERKGNGGSAARALPWVLVPLVGLFAFGLGRCVPRLGAGEGEDGHAHGSDAGEGEAEVWTCSMDPQVRQPEPGACPICGMDLIPLGDLEAEGGSDLVALSDRAAKLARIETAEVQRLLTPDVDLRLLGRIEVDENRVRNVSAWIGGRVDKLHVRETGKVVKRGQAIASLYSPEIYSAHQDLITAVRQVARFRDGNDLARASAESALEAARERLSLLGFPDGQIDSMAKDSRPRKSVAIRATYGGTVMERRVTEGQYLETGAVLYRIADLSKLWVQLDAYEADLPMLMEGQTVDLEVEALPGERFTGSIAFIDPLVDPRRRVARVRVEVDNAAGKLRPGMFVEAVVRGGGPELAEADPDADSGSEPAAPRQKPLAVPASAPLFTGKRSLVYVERVDLGEDGRPHYEPRVVDLGPRMGDVYPVVAGLQPGERVVVHGAFAIDADLQIRGGNSMMAQPDSRELASREQRARPNRVTRDALAEVVRAYLAMQVSLADDEWKTSVAAGERLVDKVAAVEAVLAQDRDPNVAEAWAKLGPELDVRAREAAGAEAIEGVRGSFLHLSAATKSLLQVYGNPLDQPLHLAFCPMASNNAGAEWIQASEVVDNSYFGASMLSCGEIRATVEPTRYLPFAGEPIEPTKPSGPTGGAAG